jgi:TetR/AcrR family transcriptional regulator, lmrAB and yxaGH operons repressor
MIVTAARMFQRDGFHATSWRGLVEEAGTPWGSIAHHFPGGKEELGIAALEAGADAVAALIEHCFAEQPDPALAVRRWFELSAQLMTSSEYSAGCPVATVALETALTSDAMREASRAAFDRWEKVIAGELRRAGATRARAAEAAGTVLALLEGALLLSRVRQSAKPTRGAARHAEAVVRAAVA